MAGMSIGGTAEKRWTDEVSGNYFDMLGVQPQLGRLFHPTDERGPNSAPFIVLSDFFWRSRFNADPRMVGKLWTSTNTPSPSLEWHPKAFTGTELFFWPDFWMPIVNRRTDRWVQFPNQTLRTTALNVLGALKPGVTAQQAADDLNSIAHRLAHENPSSDDTLSARLVKPGLMGDMLAGPARPFLSGIMVLACLCCRRPASTWPASLPRAPPTALANWPSVSPSVPPAGASCVS